MITVRQFFCRVAVPGLHSEQVRRSFEHFLGEQMGEVLRKIDAEYSFSLTEEEMDRILKEVSEAEVVLANR